MVADSDVVAPRQEVLPVSIENPHALHNAYMPFVRGGGIFVPTSRSYHLGDEVHILLSLMTEAERRLAGKVVWITPPGAQGNRAAGIGVQFSDSPEGEAARIRIEAMLAELQGSEKPTDTM
jgi:type IV pilus assembly protein PilZ